MKAKIIHNKKHFSWNWKTNKPEVIGVWYYGMLHKVYTIFRDESAITFSLSSNDIN